MQARIAQSLDAESARACHEKTAHATVPWPHLASAREGWRGILEGRDGARASRVARRGRRARPALASIARRRSARRVEAAHRMRVRRRRRAVRRATRGARRGGDGIARPHRRHSHAKRSARRERAASSTTPVPSPSTPVAIAVARDAPEGLARAPHVAVARRDVRPLHQRASARSAPHRGPLGASTSRASAPRSARRSAWPARPLRFRSRSRATRNSRGCIASLPSSARCPASTAFQRRILGNGARVADAQARVLARTALLHARLEAARFLTSRAPAAIPFETSPLASSAPLPRALAGAWPRLTTTHRPASVGLLTAPALARDLVDRFDEDWFANPRAVLHLRAIASGPAYEDPAPDPAADLASTIARSPARSRRRADDPVRRRRRVRPPRRRGRAATKPTPSPPPLPMLPSVARVHLEDRPRSPRSRGGHRSPARRLALRRSRSLRRLRCPRRPFGVRRAPPRRRRRRARAQRGRSRRAPDVRYASRTAPRHARDLLGPSQMAGVIVHVPDATFRRAVARGGMAVLRLRSLLALPEGDARTGHEVVVRLGAWQGTPLTLGSVQVASIQKSPRITGAAAHLCGAEADSWPLAVAIVPRPSPAPAPTTPAPIAPVLAVRHAADDLCLRYWTAD